jgi:hypothetical protein
MRRAKATLLVLPKWTGERDPRHDGWIASAKMARPEIPQSVLFGVDAQPRILRAPSPSGFDVNVLDLTPSLSGTIQLAQGTKLKPILATSQGILLGEIREAQRRIVVLADPDAIDNHGIGRGANAAFVRDLFEFLGGPRTTIVFDETIHGFHGGSGGGAALSTALLRFPNILLLPQAFIGLALLGWAAIGRFGAPQIPPRPLGQGKRGLIANIASLIDYGGHHSDSLRAYIEAVAQDAAQSLKAPKDLDASGLADWLDRTGKARGAQRSCRESLDIARQARPKDLRRLLEAAQAIHEWKKEIANGTF